MARTRAHTAPRHFFLLQPPTRVCVVLARGSLAHGCGRGVLARGSLAHGCGRGEEGAWQQPPRRWRYRRRRRRRRGAAAGTATAAGTAKGACLLLGKPSLVARFAARPVAVLADEGGVVFFGMPDHTAHGCLAKHAFRLWQLRCVGEQTRVRKAGVQKLWHWHACCLGNVAPDTWHAQAQKHLHLHAQVLVKVAWQQLILNEVAHIGKGPNAT